jgi:site-specific DNA-cytosine methylase
MKTPLHLLRRRVNKAIGKSDAWVLIGGPPCQAYSLVGRSRNRGIAGYRLDDDRKARLYVEYLHLIVHFDRRMMHRHLELIQLRHR